MSLSSFGSDLGSDNESNGEFDIDDIVPLKTEEGTTKSKLVKPLKIQLQNVLSEHEEEDEEEPEYNLDDVLKEDEDEVPNSFDDFDELTEESINKLLDSYISNDEVLTDYNFLEFTNSDTTMKKLEDISV